MMTTGDMRCTYGAKIPPGQGETSSGWRTDWGGWGGAAAGGLAFGGTRAPCFLTGPGDADITGFYRADNTNSGWSDTQRHVDGDRDAGHGRAQHGVQDTRTSSPRVGRRTLGALWPPGPLRRRSSSWTRRWPQPGNVGREQRNYGM